MGFIEEDNLVAPIYPKQDVDQAPAGQESKYDRASDWNTLVLDVKEMRAWVLSHGYVGLTALEEDPAPAQPPDYLYVLSTEDGKTLRYVSDGDDFPVALMTPVAGVNVVRAPLALGGTVYNSIGNPKPTAGAAYSGRFVFETVSDNPTWHLYVCVKNDADAWNWAEIMLAFP